MPPCTRTYKPKGKQSWRKGPRGGGGITRPCTSSKGYQQKKSGGRSCRNSSARLPLPLTIGHYLHYFFILSVRPHVGVLSAKCHLGCVGMNAGIIVLPGAVESRKRTRSCYSSLPRLERHTDHFKSICGCHSRRWLRSVNNSAQP